MFKREKGGRKITRVMKKETIWYESDMMGRGRKEKKKSLMVTRKIFLRYWFSSEYRSCIVLIMLLDYTDSLQNASWHKMKPTVHLVLMKMSLNGESLKSVRQFNRKFPLNRPFCPTMQHATWRLESSCSMSRFYLRPHLSDRWQKKNMIII